MDAYSKTVRCSGRILFALVLGLSGCSARTRLAEVDSGAPCAIPEIPLVYVRDSLDLLNSGTRREAILDSLACIAISQRSNRGAVSALNAIMHLAVNDEQIRAYLLRVVKNPQTDSSVHDSACMRLVYVADARVRKALLEGYEEVGGVGEAAGYLRASNYGRALVRLGDRAFLYSLEGAMGLREPADPVHNLLSSEARLIRLQLDMQSMLDAIRSNDHPIDRGWIIRQAHRHGASKAQLRAAVQDYVRRCGFDQTDVSNETSLIYACIQSRLFTEEEAMELGLPGAGARPPGWRNAEVFPSWATRYHEKWAEFWRVSP